jgi:hypothetical protein
MKVSITEDATIRRTRSEGGATIVRLDAIAIVPARRPAVSRYGSENHDTPRDEYISESSASQWKIADVMQAGSSSAPFRRFVPAYKFLAIFEETDENDHGRSRKADKKHDFQQAHGKHSK